MSDQTQIASRYANAFFALVNESKASDKIEAELVGLLSLVQENEEFTSFLSSPSVTLSEQQSVLDDLAQKTKLQQLTHNLLKLLCDNRRLALLGAVIEDVLVRMEEARGELRAEIVTAKALSAKQEKQVTEMIEKKTGRKVNARVIVKEDIIGGLIVKYGSTMIDDSVKSKLDKLKRQMKGAA